jgi:hypothetical protein
MAKTLDIGKPNKQINTTQTINTKKVESGKLVDLNFKVSAEFRKEFKMWSTAHDMTQKELLETAFNQIKQNI